MYTDATNWSKIAEDVDGTILDINFVCPECGYDTGTLIFTSQTELSSFEIDVECPVCGASLTVICD